MTDGSQNVPGVALAVVRGTSQEGEAPSPGLLDLV